MDIDIQHAKNSLMGWDIKVRVKGDKGEKVSSVVIDINGSSDANDIDPPVNIFSKSLAQKGVYPGDNEVRVTVRDPKGTETSAVDLWSAWFLMGKAGSGHEFYGFWLRCRPLIGTLPTWGSRQRSCRPRGEVYYIRRQSTLQ